MKRPGRLLILGLAVALVAAGWLVHFLYGWYGAGPLAKDVSFVVPAGASLGSIAPELEKEGVVASAAAIFDCEVLLRPDSAEVSLSIAQEDFVRLKDRRRALAGRTGCGVCGVESFAALDLDFSPLPAHDWLTQVDIATVCRAIEALSAKQLLNAQAGAIHAAGWATLDGQLHDVLEDVGRHNALDKLLGRLARSGQLQQPGFVVLSSRGSHELVRKCAKLGVAALATISAPTAMGVRMAELTGLRFWGLCRPPQAVLYAG